MKPFMGVERPILFSGEMVRAIKRGCKTQTRRVVKLPVIDRNGTGCEIAGCELNDCLKQGMDICPYGSTKNRLWIKETFRTIYDPATCLEGALDVDYRADGKDRIGDKIGTLKWKPSIFMPRYLSRITLEIEAVRAERLQDIRDADAKAEGCCGVASTQFGLPNFRYVWESINGHASWKANPWVWVICFKKL